MFRHIFPTTEWGLTQSQIIQQLLWTCSMGCSSAGMLCWESRSGAFQAACSPCQPAAPLGHTLIRHHKTSPHLSPWGMVTAQHSEMTRKENCPKQLWASGISFGKMWCARWDASKPCWLHHCLLLLQRPHLPKLQCLWEQWIKPGKHSLLKEKEKSQLINLSF